MNLKLNFFIFLISLTQSKLTTTGVECEGLNRL